MVTCEEFGLLPDGRAVKRYRIENAAGESVELLDYGAAVHAVRVRDRDGALGDVALGAPGPERLATCTYIGSTIGRCANRIAHGRFSIDGRPYQLERNMGGHFLHGASGAYANRVFRGEILPDGHSVLFRCKDLGEGGFGCQADVEVEYRFDDSSALTVVYRMTAGGDTVLNPTNHTYFNLSCGGDVRDHVVHVCARRRAARDAEGLPDGGGLDVAGTPADFTAPRSLREAMAGDSGWYFQRQPPGYDEYYLLDRREFALAAELSDPSSGRILRVYTDMPCLILFADGRRRPEPGKDGQTYEGYCGICLETQFVPNAVNCPAYDSPVFRGGETLRTRTVYAFSSENSPR